MSDTKLDRALQRRILTHLAGLYPNSEHRLKIAFPDVAFDVLIANLRYLWEHDLIAAKWMTTNTSGVTAGAATLSAKGVDFLADDGGLSAILGVVTVRLHPDTIRELLIKEIEQSPADDSTKARLIDKIKSLPASALEAATIEGLKKGLSHLPDVVAWLQKFISG